jgi:hypothetical protein
MKRETLVIIGGVLTAIWGVAHLFPTNSIVNGFGDISIDNRHIIRMEWINEGLTLIFIGLLVITVTLIKSSDRKVIKAVYVSSFIMLVAMAIVSLFTGFQVDFLPYQLCPLIFFVSGLFILQGVKIRNMEV